MTRAGKSRWSLKVASIATKSYALRSRDPVGAAVSRREQIASAERIPVA